MLEGRLTEQRAKLAALDADLSKRRADTDAIQSNIAQLRNSLPLIEQKYRMREDLSKTGHIAQTSVIDARLELINAEKDLSVQGNRLNESMANYQAAVEQRVQAVAEFKSRTSTELVDAMKKRDAAQQELIKANQRWMQQTLRAPIDGVVQQLAVTTVGGVVTSAQPLLTIVPENSPLELEAQVMNRDIGHLRVGQRVINKVETYDFTRYGYIEGEVLWVGTDAVQDPKLGLVYPVRIKLAQTETPNVVNGRKGLVTAGMNVTADIRTDERRMIEYLRPPCCVINRRPCVKDDLVQDSVSLCWRVGPCHVVWLLGALLGSLPSQAQTLMDVYQKARTNDAQYAAARKSYEAALEKLPQSIAGLLPSVNVVANRNHQIGEASFSSTPYVGRDIRVWNWTAQLTQPLIRWGNWANISQANAQVEQAKEQLALAEQGLIVRAAQAYFDVQVAMQNVQVADAQLAAVNEQLILAERTFEVGMGTITDVHEAKAKQALSLAQRVTSLNDLTTKQSELERVVGEFMPLTVMQLIQNLPPVHAHELPDWLTAAVANSPQVRIQQAALEVARHEVSKSMSAHAPTLDILANRAANFSSGTLSSPADLSTRVNSHQTGLQLTIPLFSGGATHSKVRESVALAEKAKDELTGAQRNASSQVRQAFAGVVNGQAQVEALEAAVVAGRNAVESNKIGFQIGTRINPDVLNAEQQLYTTLRDLSKARVDAVMQGLKLKAATGSLAADDLLVLERMMVPVTAATQLVQSN